MYEDYLAHYGIKGMKWGIRRSPKQLGHDEPKKKKPGIVETFNAKQNQKKVNKRMAEVRAAKQRKAEETKKEASSNKHKSVKEMSDAELREKINRLQLEKQYKDLNPSSASTQRGKKFVTDVLENSGKNISTQLSTYVMGAGVNYIARHIFELDEDIVNPKKGQKDK